METAFTRNPRWCEMNYYEKGTRVGSFKVPSEWTEIRVDGGVNPCGTQRFCLGQLTNLEQTEETVRSRQQIEKGIQLQVQGQGDVLIQVLSPRSIFIQSHFLDRETRGGVFGAVHEISRTDGKRKVFDLRICHQMVTDMVQQVYPHTAAAHLAAGIGVDALRKFCGLRISFGCGFGVPYTRTSIEQTPCWIEIQVYRALQLLDEFLQTMPSISSD